MSHFLNLTFIAYLENHMRLMSTVPGHTAFESIAKMKFNNRNFSTIEQKKQYIFDYKAIMEVLNSKGKVTYTDLEILIGQIANIPHSFELRIPVSAPYSVLSWN